MNRYLLSSVLYALLLLRCSFAPTAGGSTDTELGSVVTGRVFDGAGESSVNTRVNLIPQDHNPVLDTSLPDYFTDSTDSIGDYFFNDVPPGTYNILADDSLSKRAVLIPDLEVGAVDTETVRSDTLRQTGSIAVERTVPSNTADGFYYIPGTFFFVSPAENAVFNGVPPGNITCVCFTEKSDSIRNYTIITGVEVVAGDTTFIADHHEWLYSDTIILNTTESGADISNNVLDFPLLLRLTGDNFDFDQVREYGEDLRFTKRNGFPLPYEIERWDTAARQAVIWVKVDTVRGNDSTQSIIMYWGNPVAPDNSNSAAVFDTAGGFQGVWHLSDASEDSVRDATVNGYHGVSPDTASPSITEGDVGNCREFDGTSEFITMPNTATGKLDFPQNGTYSVSAWVMADTFVDLQQTLVSKGRFQYFLWIDSTSWEFWELQDQNGWEVSEQQATLKQWVLLTGVRNGARQYLYVNGVYVDSLFLITNAAPRNTEGDLNFGRAHELENASEPYSNPCYFRGKIDEVRISSVSRNADWIKLCFMNQRVDDRLIQFK